MVLVLVVGAVTVYAIFYPGCWGCCWDG
jgi:hypothetical protein